MERDLPYPELIASARQIMDIPEEDAMHEEEAPLTITWFALGHAAVLLYVALNVLKIMSPMERGLAGGAVLLLGLVLVLLLRNKLKAAMAMAEVVVPAVSDPKATDAR